MWSVFEILTQITLEDENELAEIPEVFAVTMTTNLP